MTGYKKAIWERIPDSWRKATEHCRCKQRLVNNIYNDMINCVKTKCTNEKRWDKDYVKKVKNTIARHKKGKIYFLFPYQARPIRVKEGEGVWGSGKLKG